MRTETQDRETENTLEVWVLLLAPLSSCHLVSCIGLGWETRYSLEINCKVSLKGMHTRLL